MMELTGGPEGLDKWALLLCFVRIHNNNLNNPHYPLSIIHPCTHQSQPGTWLPHHKQTLPRDIPRLTRNQEPRRIRNILHLPQPRHPHLIHRLLLPTLPQIPTELRLDESWADTVHSDVVVEEFPGEEFGEGDEGGFGDGVVADYGGEVVYVRKKGYRRRNLRGLLWRSWGVCAGGGGIIGLGSTRICS